MDSWSMCPTCRGTWLDGGELSRLTKKHETTRKSIAALSSDADESERECPRCQKEMVEGGLLDSDLSVEYCGGCDGLWFDATELKQTILFFESQPIDIPDYLLRKKGETSKCRKCSREFKLRGELTRAYCPKCMKQCKRCGYEFEEWATRKDSYSEGGTFDRNCCPRCDAWASQSTSQDLIVCVFVALVAILMLSYFMGW